MCSGIRKGIQGMDNEYADKPDNTPGFLELIYGVLFDPVKTFRRIAQSPPLGSSAVIFSMVKVLSAAVGGYISARYMSDLPGHE